MKVRFLLIFFILIIAACSVLIKHSPKPVILPILSPDRYFLLTIDDGPNEYTRDIFNYIKSKNYDCYWFVSNQNDQCSKYPSLLNDIIKSGHTIGNHTDSHDLKKFRYSGYDEIYEDVNKINEHFKQTFDYTIRLFRPPYGVQRKNILPQVRKKLNLHNFLWHIDILDSRKKVKFSKEELNRTIRSQVENRPQHKRLIVLLHSFKYTRDNIKDIISVIENCGKIRTLGDTQ